MVEFWGHESTRSRFWFNFHWLLLTFTRTIKTKCFKNWSDQKMSVTNTFPKLIQFNKKRIQKDSYDIWHQISHESWKSDLGFFWRAMWIVKVISNKYRKVVSTNMCRSKPHPGIYRLFIKWNWTFMYCDLLGKSCFLN